MIAMDRIERSIHNVISDRIEAYSVIELTEIHDLNTVYQNECFALYSNLEKQTLCAEFRLDNDWAVW